MEKFLSILLVSDPTTLFWLVFILCLSHVESPHYTKFPMRYIGLLAMPPHLKLSLWVCVNLGHPLTMFLFRQMPYTVDIIAIPANFLHAGANSYSKRDIVFAILAPQFPFLVLLPSTTRKRTFILLPLLF